MENAVWLAQIFGPIFVLLGCFILFRSKEVMKLWASAKATPVALYLGGVLNLLIGFTVLSLYSDWSWNLAVLVTLLGYVQVLRGILVLFCSNLLMKFSDKLMKPSSLRIMSCLPIVWGLALLWLGFCSQMS